MSKQVWMMFAHQAWNDFCKLQKENEHLKEELAHLNKAYQLQREAILKLHKRLDEKQDKEDGGLN
jgi:Txe/YoeB family toxin of Txe-Axe toxin-antitoxin module